MLEKIGLPARPSKRGSNWVVDASHCQGCSSQFTFFNRKHHCRRCGGLFCNSCTLQRMILRGQGDSPVRICDPCKQLEDAARFELRYGHRNRAAKGNLKHTPELEEEVLGQILATDRKQPLLAGRESQADVISGLRKTVSGASSSSLKEGSATQGRFDEILRSPSIELPNNGINDMESRSPEDLRKQAVEEKNKYKILKGEGKSKEALQAYKHGKELERQAEALEIALKREKKMTLNSSKSRNSAYAQNKDDNDESISKTLPSRRGKDKEVDLASELRDLGWSDADLHDADKKPTKMTLEGELSNLLGEVPKKGTSEIDKSQVIAHKKKALALKREGNLVEAREELKRAKILERQLEEQELLGGDDDSDDELSALIRSMNEEKQDNLLIDHAPLPDFDFGLEVGNDFSIDGNFEATDDDMNDPELAAALKSFGWSDEEEENKSDHMSHADPLDFEALQSQVLYLKKEALSQKQAGNVAEAMALLKKAKLLEKDLENMQSDEQTITPGTMQRISNPLASAQSLQRVTGDENAVETKSLNAKPPKSKLMIQKDLLTLKKKALALRREGRLEEAEEELKKGKVLEQQLEEMENAPKVAAVKVGNKGGPEALDIDVGVEADVTEQDMHDPALLSVLKNLGWSEDDNVESASMATKTSKQLSQQSTHETVPSVVPQKVMRNKAEIQRELLQIKRKALLLRRQGKVEEAEQELERAKALENEMAEMESANPVKSDSHGVGSLVHQERSDAILKAGVTEDEKIPKPEVPETNSNRGNETKCPFSSLATHGPFEFEPVSVGKLSYQSVGGSEHTVSVLPQSVHSVNIIDFPSVGDIAISRSSEDSVQKENSNVNTISHAEVSNQPAIEVNAKVNTLHKDEMLSHSTSSTRIMYKPETATSTRQPVIPIAHRFDDQKAEILAHKRKAVALKREGKLVEAREELRKAKLLVKSLEDADQAIVDSEKTSASKQAIVGSENASAYMQATVGSRYASASTQTVVGSENTSASTSNRASVTDDDKTNRVQKPVSGRDRFKLQQESLSHKRNALKLRREGKTAEAEAEFELAKALESQLEEGQGSSANASFAKVEAIDDTVVEDLLDPQLMSALKSIGWGDVDVATQSSKKSESKPNADRSGSSQIEKTQLEEQIKAEKLRALNLKRAGKSDQALEALRSAKRLEKKLGLLAS